MTKRGVQKKGTPGRGAPDELALGPTPRREVPEISDLVVDFDPETLARRDVRKDAVLAALAAHGMARAAAIVADWPAPRGVLDEVHVDGVLVRSHLEMQRLSEEFQQGARMARLLQPLVDAARGSRRGRPPRVVDVGCGLGYVTRWLASSASLGDPVELVGCDYNAALVRHAARLAASERLPCRFLVANAFALEEPADVYTSTGVIHHFRGAALGELFAEQARTRPIGFVHCDIKPSWLAPLGSWLFHQARMREPLAKVDGVLSAVRAHSGEVLADAAKASCPDHALFLFDAERERLPILKVMQALIGVRSDLADAFVSRLGPLRARVRRVEGT